MKQVDNALSARGTSAINTSKSALCAKRSCAPSAATNMSPALSTRKMHQVPELKFCALPRRLHLPVGSQSVASEKRESSEDFEIVAEL